MAVKMSFCKGLTKKILRVPLLFTFLVTGACQSAGNQMSARLNDDTYPDLLTIPPAPKNVKTEKEWSNLAKELDQKERYVRTLPNARDYDARQWDMKWADKATKDLEKNPKNGIIPDIKEAEAWAARLRAIMDKHKR